MKNTALILLLFTSLNLAAQFQIEWELHVPSGISSFQPFDFNENKHFKTYKVGNEEFITVSLKNKVRYGSYIQLIRYNSNGEIIWEYLHENNTEYGEWMTDSHIDSDDNILISASTVVGEKIVQDGEIVYIITESTLFKVSQNGTLLWQINEEFDTTCEAVATDNENNIYAIGHIDTTNHLQSTLYKYNSDGNLLFKQNIDERHAFDIQIIDDEIIAVTKGTGQNDNRAYWLALEGQAISNYTIEWLGRKKPTLDQDGNLYSMFGVGKFNLTKYNKSGMQEWVYIKPSNTPDNVHADESIGSHIDQEGNILVTGRHYGKNYNTPSYTNCDILTTKLTPEGDIIWEDIYNYDNTRSCQIAYHVKTDDEGNTYSVGRQSREKDGEIYGSVDMVLLKYDNQGNRIDSIIYNGAANNEDRAANVMIDSSSLYLIGISQDDERKFRNSVIKYSRLSKVTEFADDSQLHIYPNPFDDIINISLENHTLHKVQVLNMDGKSILESNNNSRLNLSNLPSGMYFLRVHSDIRDRILTKKIVKQ